VSRSRWWLALACGVLASQIAAQTSPSTNERDPRAVALLDQCGAAYKALKGIHTRMHAEMKSNASSNSIAIEVWFQRPASFRVATTKSWPDRTAIRTLVVSDGKSIVRYWSNTNTYTTGAYSTSRLRSELGNALPEGELIVYGSPKGLLLGAGTDPLEQGPSRKRNGIDVDVVTLKQSHQSSGGTVDVTVEFYIRRSDRMFQGMSIDSQGPKSSPSETGHADVINEVVEPNPKFPAGFFRFTPPPGATSADAKAKPASKAKAKPK
jgi:outer membrane lipoprotein-sorting protein